MRNVYISWREGERQRYILRNTIHVFSCTVMAKSFENDTIINFHKVCCLSVYDGNLHILQNVMKSDQMNCN